MIRLTAQSRVLLAVQPVDFRKQFDSLIRLCSQRSTETKSEIRNEIRFYQSRENHNSYFDP
jgi:hypothetical protein